jgi:putative thiamine transport system ATP-binding protein
MTLSLNIEQISLDSHVGNRLGNHLGNHVGNRILVQGVNLDVANGQIATLMGASGSGKSSILAAIAGTLSEDLTFKGAISLNGKRVDDLPTSQRNIGLLFQDDLLFAHMTVFENLLFAVPAGDKAARKESVNQALLEADLVGFGDRDPATLSGGQRARVALMRALLAKPQALLLDEPFSKLDAALRERFKEFVFNHVRARNIPVLMVTHDRADVADAQLVIELPTLLEQHHV